MIMIVLLCFIDPRVRKIRNEASSCPGIFSRTLRFYYVASSPVCCFVLLNRYWGIVTVTGYPRVNRPQKINQVKMGLGIFDFCTHSRRLFSKDSISSPNFSCGCSYAERTLWCRDSKHRALGNYFPVQFYFPFLLSLFYFSV